MAAGDVFRLVLLQTALKPAETHIHLQCPGVSQAYMHTHKVWSQSEATG